MSKSLRRLDAVQNATADLKTQTATVTFKPGKPVDFAALSRAVDRAGFTAGSITIWANGVLSARPDGTLAFTVSGTKQTFPVAESPHLAKLKSEIGKEIPLVAGVRFEETPPRLVIEEESAKSGTGSIRGTESMRDVKDMEKNKMGEMKGIQKK